MPKTFFFPFAESALTEGRTAVEYLNEDVSTAEKDKEVSESLEAKLLQELSEKDSAIRGLRMSHRVLEEEFLQFRRY